MLFNRYNLFKNHGEFVHLNMLKWALKFVPELGKKTVSDDETVKSIDIGVGGVDVKTVNDTSNQETEKHVPYTDVQVNSISQPVANFATDNYEEMRSVTFDNGDKVKLDNYTKVIASKSLENLETQEPTVKQAISFYDLDPVKVDGVDHNYITQLAYLNKGVDGAITTTDDVKEFKPYTSIMRDDNSLASQVKILHDGEDNLIGLSMPVTGEVYSIKFPETDNRPFEIAGVYNGIDEHTGMELFGNGYPRLMSFVLSQQHNEQGQKLNSIMFRDMGNKNYAIDVSSLNLFFKEMSEN